MNCWEAYDRAVILGTEAHAGKKWHAGSPYTEHLKAVEKQIVKYLSHNQSDDVVAWLRAAAWLHDAVEDAGVSLDVIERECGKEVRTLVWAVTDEPGANRKERHEKTYPKIKNVAHAVALKLADRIANVEVSANNRGGFFDMYRKEYSDFRRALYTPGQYENMWFHLDGLMANDPEKQAIRLADELLAELRKMLPENNLNDCFYGNVHKRFASIIHQEIKKS